MWQWREKRTTRTACLQPLKDWKPRPILYFCCRLQLMSKNGSCNIWFFQCPFDSIVVNMYLHVLARVTAQPVWWKQGMSSAFCIRNYCSLCLIYHCIASWSIVAVTFASRWFRGVSLEIESDWGTAKSVCWCKLCNDGSLCPFEIEMVLVEWTMQVLQQEGEQNPIIDTSNENAEELCPAISSHRTVALGGLSQQMQNL